MAINFSGISGLSGLFGDYSAIKNGSYKKLLNAYYSKVDGSREATMEKFSQKVSKEESSKKDSLFDKNLNSVKSSADSLGISASNLVNKGIDSVFQKKEIEKVDEKTGEKVLSLEYDREEIRNAVSEFVSDYNAVLDKTADTDSTKVMSKTLDMISNTNIYKSSLERIGISIGSDNKLTIDEKKFDEANLTSVKSLFNDSNSFGQRTLQKSLQISSEATKAQLNVYTSKGSFEKLDYSSLLNMYL